MPKKSLLYCLEAAGLTLPDIDYIAYYEMPEKKLARQLWSGVLSDSDDVLDRLDPTRAEKQIRELIGYKGPIKFYEHHESHAASSFFFSGFKEAAILTVDGVGEWATTTYGIGKNNQIDLFEEVHFPDSIGLLYSTITSYLGFGVNDGEYKVMGLAPYGNARYTNEMRKLILMQSGGQYQLDMKYFDFLKGERMYSEAICELFGKPARQTDLEINQFHIDVAKSLQVVLEEILIEKAQYLYEKTGMKNLCMAGGVALNCVANGKVLKHGPFKRLFVQPASNDAGGCLGAAALAYAELTGNNPRIAKTEHVYLGPSYTSTEIGKLLQSTSIVYQDYRHNSEELLGEIAKRLADGKVIGWFHGRMEFGPRSLGARSILANPMDSTMRDLINAIVKKREGFRPFAPAVLETKAHEHFDLDHRSPFMLETCQVVSKLDLPAITHVDGSARVQTVCARTNPRFAALLEAFEKLTSCPILLNTSFNVKGEPIVCTPEDALKCFITTNIDCLVLEDFIIDRDKNILDVLEWMINMDEAVPESTHNLYTFI